MIQRLFSAFLWTHCLIYTFTHLREELTSQGILITKPDDISNSNISFSGIPLWPSEDIWTSELGPGLPEIFHLSLNLLKALVWIFVEIKWFEVAALRHPPEKKCLVSRTEFDLLNSELVHQWAAHLPDYLPIALVRRNFFAALQTSVSVFTKWERLLNRLTSSASFRWPV